MPEHPTTEPSTPQTALAGPSHGHRLGRVLSWAPDCVLSGALAQAAAVAARPGVADPVALMPDAHPARGVCVGAVIASEGRIVPAAAGVDLGCGMTAVRLSMDASQLPDDLTPVLDAWAQAIPARNHQPRRREPAGRREALSWLQQNPPPDPVEASLAARQLGTLGGGNHFVEASIDTAQRVWLVLHSGSRGAGHTAATHHIGIAATLDPAAGRDLAALVEASPEFAAYVSSMDWAQTYASINREAIAAAALAAFGGACRLPKHLTRVAQTVACHHNYARVETHQQRRLWITRKGAISAAAGELGIVPGSMGDATFIVEGLGSAASWQSAAHGAGRRMRRSEARTTLDLAEFEEAMTGRVWRHRDAKRLLDEAPAAYKPISEVMAAQTDLCRPVEKLTAVVNYKGL